ncbi:nonstructural protein [Capybara microvirus Cap1_SP_131]|nr:nonstructural protein [Capybara microvirus Cap1_SP_131]
MLINLYSQRDLKTRFSEPVPDLNDDSAIRNFTFSLRNANDIRAFMPADFQLFRVGQFNTATGELIPCLPVLLIDGVSAYGKE